MQIAIEYKNRFALMQPAVYNVKPGTNCEATYCEVVDIETKDVVIASFYYLRISLSPKMSKVYVESLFH